MDERVGEFLDAISDNWIPRVAAVIFVSALAITVAVAITQNIYAQLGATLPPTIDSIDAWKLGMVTGTAGTATAFLVTLYVAQRDYKRGRKHIPNLSMFMKINRVTISQSYDALVVTVDAKNTGSGLCEVREVEWEAAVLSPYDDDGVEEMLEEFESRDPQTQRQPSTAAESSREVEFPWHSYERRPIKVDMSIEPGETEQLTQDFVIDYEIEAVVISVWVSNALSIVPGTGWLRRTVHTLEEQERYA